MMHHSRRPPSLRPAPRLRSRKSPQTAAADNHSVKTNGGGGSTTATTGAIANRQHGGGTIRQRLIRRIHHSRPIILRFMINVLVLMGLYKKLLEPWAFATTATPQEQLKQVVDITTTTTLRMDTSTSNGVMMNNASKHEENEQPSYLRGKQKELMDNVLRSPTIILPTNKMDNYKLSTPQSLLISNDDKMDISHHDKEEEKKLEPENEQPNQGLVPPLLLLPPPAAVLQ